MGGSDPTNALEIRSFEGITIALRFLHRDIAEVSGAVGSLKEAVDRAATKDQIAALYSKLDGYDAVHAELRAFKVDVEHRLQGLESGTVQGTIKTWAEWAQRLAAIIAFASVTGAAIAHLWVKLGP